MKTSIVVCRLIVALLWLTPVNAEEQDPRITQASALFSAKKYAELKPLLLELHQGPAPHLEVLFLTGMLAAEEGDFAKAADEFRAMLARDPSLIRPRLELASALQKNGDRQAAKYHYEQALAADLPDQVKRNIYHQLGDIRERTPSLRMSLDLVTDSNPRQSSNSKTIYINGLPYTLNDNSRAKAVYGISLSADARWPLPMDPTWFASGYLEINEYPNRELDSKYAQATIGKRFDFGENNISTEIGGHISSYRDHKQYDGWMVRNTTFVRVSSRLFMTTELSYKTYSYPALPFLDGDMKSLSVTGIFIPQATQRLDGSVGVSQYSANEAAYSYIQPSISVRFMQEWPGGWLTGIRLQGLYAEYAAPDPFFGKTRRDTEGRIETDVLNRKLKLWKFSPKLLVGYVDRSSTLDLYSYRRAYARMGLSMDF